MTARVDCGDWRDVLPGTYDPATTVVITDPPYGLAGLIGPDGFQDKGFPDAIPWATHVRDVLELLPAKRHAIRGPAPMLIRRDYPTPRRLCIEMAPFRRRAKYRPGVVPYLWQGWAIYGRLLVATHRPRYPAGDALSSSRFAITDQRANRPRTATNHRALTPFLSASWIVETWADPGDLVLDPFAGLGTIGLAARSLGFDYVGAEISAEYATAAGVALGAENLTLGLNV